jgi:hypothetical protein
MKHVRFRDLQRALRKLGCTVEPSPGGSSHFHVTREGRTYPIPASHGLKAEIPDVYVKAICRALDLDERALRSLL